ncbi:Sporulation membrane protein YtrH [Paenibacillus solanacearum]|uniref:Sporulation membrane protein YtrH n=1 Tax=Paenibacillus solanacearum TaxID=2048548 RepID=A0A916K7D4_9BACL|nr:YtrH family sporulation protein [Paenibacillus solanacearum]CAG7646684.1 Sporulation membrane protein YtrH [Paenibacillus solanacearum]
MAAFVSKCLLDFFVAFGVVLGGTMLAGISAVFTLEPPVYRMTSVAEQIKIWAMVAAIGGTIDPIRAIETNFIEGHISPAIKQIVYIVCAFTGAHMGSTLIQWICKGGANG